jgi:hypothetical protein
MKMQFNFEIKVEIYGDKRLEIELTRCSGSHLTMNKFGIHSFRWVTSVCNTYGFTYIDSSQAVLDKANVGDDFYEQCLTVATEISPSMI